MYVCVIDDHGRVYRGSAKVGDVRLRAGAEVVAHELLALAPGCNRVTAWIIDGPMSGTEGQRAKWADRLPPNTEAAAAVTVRPGAPGRGGTSIAVRCERGSVTLRSAEPWGWKYAPAAAAAIARWDDYSTGVELDSAPSAIGLTLARLRGAWSGLAPLPAQLEATIRATTTQGRMDFFADSGPVAEVVEVDARAAYLGLLTKLPSGPAQRHYGGGVAFDDVRWLNGWWHVRCWPPSGVRYGLVPCRVQESGPVTYPTSGRVDTWVSGVELDLLHRHGWHPEIVEGWTWAPGAGPLDSTANKLLGIYADDDATVSRIARTVAVHLVGSLFQGRHHRPVVGTLADLQASTSAVNARQITAHRWQWTETTTQRRPHWRPELAAQVWARGRARLLSAPTGAPGVRAGLLHLPEGVRAVGAHTDALYLTADPQWPDDGRVGRYRCKSTFPVGELAGLRSIWEARQ